MSRADAIQSLINEFATRLDSCLDATDGDVLTRIAVMECRDALLKYGGLWDAARCRKAVEKFLSELQATGFSDELLRPVRATCQRMVAVLRSV